LLLGLFHSPTHSSTASILLSQKAVVLRTLHQKDTINEMSQEPTERSDLQDAELARSSSDDLLYDSHSIHFDDSSMRSFNSEASMTSLAPDDEFSLDNQTGPTPPSFTPVNFAVPSISTGPPLPSLFNAPPITLTWVKPLE